MSSSMRIAAIVLLLIASSAAKPPRTLRNVLPSLAEKAYPRNDGGNDMTGILQRELGVAWHSLKADMSMSMSPVEPPPAVPPPTQAPQHAKTEAPVPIVIQSFAPTIQSTPSLNPTEIVTATFEPSFMVPVSSPILIPSPSPVASPILAPVGIPAPFERSPTLQAPVASPPTLSIPNIQPSIKGPTVLGSQDKVPTPSPRSTGGNGMGGGAIAGIVLAVLAVVAAVAAVAWKYTRDRQTSHTMMP